MVLTETVCALFCVINYSAIIIIVIMKFLFGKFEDGFIIINSGKQGLLSVFFLRFGQLILNIVTILCRKLSKILFSIFGSLTP